MTLAPERILERIWKALPAQLGSVVGEEAVLAEPVLAREWNASGKRYYAELELVEPRKGTLWMSFELPLAIASAGHLVMRPRGAIVENIQTGVFDGDDIDAMGECVNTFCAALNDAVRAGLGDDHRIVFRRGTLDAPELGELGTLAVASARLQLGELASGELALVVPESVFAIVHEETDDDEDEEDDEGDDDEEEDDELDAPPPLDADGDAPPVARKRKRKAKGKRKSSDAHDDDGDAEAGRVGDARKDAAGPLLTPDELAAIREATRDLGGSATLIVAEQRLARERWRESIGTSEEFELCGNEFQMIAACRARAVETIVIDADACGSGGLSILALIRGLGEAPPRRVVIASQPTRSHMIACLAGGASEYLCGPADADELRRALAPT